MTLWNKKVIKNAQSALLSYISTRDLLKNTREMPIEKHEPKVIASGTSRVLLKIP